MISDKIAELPQRDGVYPMGSIPNPQILSFADCSLDLQTAELRRNGTRITLQDQPFQILTALLETPGQLVTREELIKRLWPSGIFVDFDQSLNKGVGRLREALGDNAESPTFVETLPRKGYRWIGPSVSGGKEPRQESNREEQSERQKARESSGSTARNLRSFYLPILTMVLAVGVWWKSGWIAKLASSLFAESTPIRSVAVLPLQNLLGDPSKEYVVDGITDSLITDLAGITDARVISRTSAMHYKGTHKMLPEVARELKVDAIVEGSVSELEGQLRINLQLIVADTDSHLWARAYEGDPRNILLTENQFAHDVAHQLLSRSGTSNGGGWHTARLGSAHNGAWTSFH